jgi:hypothetical protein
MEKSKLNMLKEFERYQERLRENRKNIVNEFLNGLIKYNINLVEMDKLIVKREEWRFLVNNTISQSVNGVESELFTSTTSSYSETEILRDVIKRKIIEEELGITIRYKNERSISGTIEIWTIDCTEIK